MKHRSKKRLRRGNQQYFNANRPVNLRVAFSGPIAAAFSRQSSQRPLGRIVSKPSISRPWFAKAPARRETNDMLVPVDLSANELIATSQLDVPPGSVPVIAPTRPSFTAPERRCLQPRYCSAVFATLEMVERKIGQFSRRSPQASKLPESLDPACSLAFRRSGAARGSGSVPRSSLTWGPRGTTLCPEG
jgi:hypothetical protein